MHARASINDVKRALQLIGRRELLGRVEEALKPKENPNKKIQKRQFHIKQAIARFMMLKRMGMTLPSAQAEKARRHALLDQSAMTMAMTQQATAAHATHHVQG